MCTVLGTCWSLWAYWCKNWNASPPSTRRSRRTIIRPQLFLHQLSLERGEGDRLTTFLHTTCTQSAETTHARTRVVDACCHREEHGADRCEEEAADSTEQRQDALYHESEVTTTPKRVSEV